MDYTIEYYTPPEGEEKFKHDFVVRDEDDEIVATVWGDSKTDLEVDCCHQEIQWGDDDEVGVCQICGADCLWHWSYDKLVDEHPERVIDEWSIPLAQSGSVIEKELDNLIGEEN